MLLRSGLPVDFWYDAYETSNYLTVRLPTKTAHGYITPFEGVYGKVPDLSHLRIWGCKSYLKLPKNYQRKDWRDKCFSGYFIGYSEPGEMGYRLFIPELRETVVGVHVTFNEVIPTYTEEYFNELNKLKFEVAPDESTVASFQHLVGEKYFDDDTLLEFITTRVVEYMSHIVAYRAPVLANDKIGREEKSPIHVADVLRLVEKSGPGEVPMTSRGEVPATNSVLRLGEKSGRREISAISRGEDPATKSSSKPGSRFDRADVPVGVDTVEHKVIAVRRDAKAGVLSDNEQQTREIRLEKIWGRPK
jgi:hypothetical protein